MDYSAEIAEKYAASRDIHGEVLASLIREGRINENSRVLEAGCGSCNYLRAMSAVTRCSVAGLDPSDGMLTEARRLGGVAALEQARAEHIAEVYPSETFDLVFSVDVIHHISDISAYLVGAHEVLRANGRICTVTDSEAIIRGRRPLSTYWPETVPHELHRYPSLDALSDLLGRSGFSDLFRLTVSREYRLYSAAAYERKAFSSLHLISVEEFERGLARLQADLSRGPIIANSAYVLMWGTKA